MSGVVHVVVAVELRQGQRCVSSLLQPVPDCQPGLPCLLLLIQGDTVPKVLTDTVDVADESYQTHVLEDEQADLYCSWSESVLLKFRCAGGRMGHAVGMKGGVMQLLGSFAAQTRCQLSNARQLSRS